MYPAGIPAGPPDWYAALNLAASASTEQIAAAVERMSRQASALSVTAPERSRLLRDQIRAIKQDLLSGDDQRQRYDQQRAQAEAARAQGRNMGWSPALQRPAQGAAWQAPARQAPAWQAPAGQAPTGQAGAQFAGLVSRVAKFLQTGWTCATCGYGALPNDKFCHKCGSPIDVPAIAQAQQPRPAGQQPPPPAAQPAPPANAGQPANPGQPAQHANAAQAARQAPPPAPAGQAAQPIFCGRCGGSIAADNTFCTQCGAARG